MAEEENKYGYYPSVPAAVIAIIIFAILLFIHLFKLFRTRTWFCIPFSVGAIFEVVGFGARAYGNHDPYSSGIYIIQALTVLLAPILFTASVYMFLSRVIRATGFPDYSIMRPAWLTKIFVGGDILCLCLVATGASMLTSDNKDSRSLGKGVVLAGLSFQLILFAFFVAVAVVFHRRLLQRCSAKSIGWPWEKYLYMLYAVSVIITVRNIFRVAEYAMGDEGYLLSNEWPTYVFDAALMVIVLGICTMWYVRGVLPDEKTKPRGDFEMMVGDEETSYEGPALLGRRGRNQH